MQNNRIAAQLAAAAERGGALLPYFTAGFPDLDTSAELIRTAGALGAAVVEIGFPYSDSIADGPVIQGSFHDVLERGHRVEDSFALAARVRATVACGVAAMVSYSIVNRIGLHEFMRRAAAAGLDGVILPDLPIEESMEAADAAARAGLCHIGLVAPTTPPARREAIARASSGFIYQIAVSGTTGERADLPPELPGEVMALKRAGGLPVCVGFGVSSADHVRRICTFADGAIVGSAIVRRIAQAVARGENGPTIVEGVEMFLKELMSGLGRK